MSEIRELSSISDSEFQDWLRRDEVVALVGAGISLWAPTDLPTGRDFTGALFRILFRDECGRLVDRNERLLRQVYELLPFEVVNERCPDEAGIRALLGRVFDVYRPNPIHELFARALKERWVWSIITPNYDCSLDAAIAAEFHTSIGRDMGPIARVVFEGDAKDANPRDLRVFFKIHGSTDDPSGESLVFRLQQEGVLKPWKREVFHKAIEGRPLLIVGYSGRDFDICPEIALAKPLCVVWNVQDRDRRRLPPNAETVARRVRTMFIASDMRDLLGRLYEPVEAHYGCSRLDLDGMFRRAFPEPIRRLWRTRALNSLTYNRSALTETERFLSEPSRGPDFDVEVLSEHAGASASYGSYKQAALTHEQACAVARFGGLQPEAGYRQLLFASDAWRCHGDFARALICHLRVVLRLRNDIQPSPSLRAALFRNEVLMIRHLYDFFKRTLLLPLAPLVQARADRVIRQTVEILRDAGEWYPLQQMGLWSERLDLPPEVTLLRGEYETPPSLEGYTQLNFPMGRMMAFRHDVDKGKIVITESSGEEARRLADLAKELGIRPEIWKLHLLILRKFKSERSFCSDFCEFWTAFWGCEYTLGFRIWRLILRT